MKYLIVRTLHVLGPVLLAEAEIKPVLCPMADIVRVTGRGREILSANGFESKARCRRRQGGR